MALAPGTRLGPYEVLAQIGAGNMGEVYKATDTNLGRQVAIKVLPEAVAHDAERLARFDREAKTLAALNHPNIAQIHGLEKSEGAIALVMELVEGDDLSQRIEQGAIPIDEALPIAKQIAEALEAAHEQGIIHRDLKPANIKVRFDGTVKVLDFGLAKAMEPTSGSSPSLSMSPTITSPAMTQAGMILGTAAYMSPEQARGKTLDKRTDIWAFGAILYEMLTGRRPFDGEDMTEVLGAVVRLEPQWEAIPSTVPARVSQTLRLCLRKDPKQRVSDIRDVRLALEGAFEVAGPQTRPAMAAMPWHERVAWTLVIIAVLAVAALATPALHLREVTPEPVVTRFEFATPPTTEPFSFALSPDGRQIVFVAVAEGASKLWLRRLDQTGAQPIAGTERASAPFWAPDGRALGFFADAKLKRIDLAGGAPQVLADASAARGGTWNRDGVIVFAAGTTGLQQVTAAGGIATGLTRPTRGEAAHWWPQFLPDGRRFLFYAPGPPDTQGVYLGSLDGGDPSRLLASDTAAAYAPPGYLLQVSQGMLVARRFDAARGVVSSDALPVASSVGSDATNRGAVAVSAADVLAHRGGAAGRRQLVWVDRSGKTLGVLVPPEDTGLSYVELAPDGRRVAVLRIVQGNNDVWLIDMDRSLTSRFTFDPANDTAPLWSPDGRRLVFRSSRNGHYDVFDKPANGAADEQPLFITTQDKQPQALSPDGRFLLYAVQDPKTQSDLWALPLVGDRKPFPVVQTSFDDVQGQFSPDGQWLAYASNESGSYEVYVRPVPGPGGKWQVSTGGGIFPRWRHDGKELFYVAPDNRMMAVPIHITADGRTPNPGTAVALFPTRLTTGNVGMGGFSSRAQYAVAADGRFLLNVNVDDAVASPITVVLNWAAGLKP